MKVSAWLGAIVVALATASACSSSPPPRPPVEGDNPGVSPGGAGAPPTTDSGGESDAGSTFVEIEDGGLEGGECNSGSGCGGCCTSLNRCSGGTSNAACGISGVTCQVCLAGTNCTNGNCI